jgi:hypothetical protein
VPTTVSSRKLLVLERYLLVLTFHSIRTRTRNDVKVGIVAMA